LRARFTASVLAVALEFRILGPLEVRSPQGEVALRGARARALLLALLAERGRPVPADRLATALWGSDAPHDAARAVRVQVSRLRAALGDPDALVTTPAGYELRAEDVDADRFEALLAEGRALLAGDRPDDAGERLREALALWRGPVPDELGVDAGRLEDLRLDALEARIDADLAAGRHAALTGELQALTEQHPGRERLHELRMLALYRAGRQAEALDAYRQAHAYLAGELGIEPSPALRELERRILNQDPELDAAADGGAAATALVGRGGELDALAEQLASARLITLCGPGGVGKSALARALCERVGGGRIVELAGVTSVAPALADALGVAAPELRRAAPGLTGLLVLDNFEHVLDDAPLVAGLLEASAGLTVVATSQVPLNLTAERVYPVEPLPEAHAIELFEARARARDPRFALGPHNAGAVATICRRLGGLPLALELAAARIGFLEPDELAGELDHALGVLVGGARDAPGRHRTLRATLDWSHALLDDAEQRAFAKLAAFAGEARLDAALAVTEADLMTLEALAATHLVTRAGRRLRMLEPVRQYAAERLHEDRATRERHARWFLDFARRSGADAAQEGDELRAAFDWALAAGEGELALALACACGPWWARTGNITEGMRRLQAALDLAGESAPARLRADALRWRARMQPRATEYAALRRADLEASLALWRELGDAAMAIDCELWLSDTERKAGDRAAAVARAEAALAAARELGDDALIARALASRLTADPGQPGVVTRTREALGALLRLDLVDDALRLLTHVGYTAVADGRLEEALAILGEGLPIAEQVDVANVWFFAHGNLGLVHFFLGDDRAAADGFRRSLEAARDCEIEEVQEALRGLAAVAAHAGELERAATLVGAAAAHATVAVIEEEVRVDQLLSEQHLEPARRRLGAARWDELAARGARLSRDQAIELALAD